MITKKLFNKNFDRILSIVVITVAAAYIGLAIFAPITRYLGWNKTADFIYFVYGFFCHQKPWRSIHLFDYQMAFCVRDLFMFVPILVVGIFSLLKTFKLKPISPVWLIILASPMIVDGAYQLFSEISAIALNQPTYYESTNFIRFLTSTAFGIALSLFIFPTIQKEFGNDRKEAKIQLRRITVITTFFISTAVYISFIYLWNATSERYKPANFLDHQVKIPGITYENIDRKGHIR